MRTPTYKEYCHERLGDEFGKATSDYDTQRRVQVLIDDFLSDSMLQAKTVLDVGCGLGYFSERLHQRGADVTACDIGAALVEKTRRRVGCKAEVADALQLVEQFGRDRFDLVVSSECIEHTPSPPDALRQMVGVCKPGGFIAVSTPNFIWLPAVLLATTVKFRPFDGYENFSSWRGMRKTLEAVGVQILREYGLHLFPFQLRLHKLSTWCDRHLQWLRGLMINICMLGRKNGNP